MVARVGLHKSFSAQQVSCEAAGEGPHMGWIKSPPPQRGYAGFVPHQVKDVMSTIGSELACWPHHYHLASKLLSPSRIMYNNTNYNINIIALIHTRLQSAWHKIQVKITFTEYRRVQQITKKQVKNATQNAWEPEHVCLKSCWKNLKISLNLTAMTWRDKIIGTTCLCWNTGSSILRGTSAMKSQRCAKTQT